jgi:LacI family transcriptional regulator
MARRRGDRAAAWAIEQRELAAWVRSLPKPAGVFCCYDIRGRQILEACRSINLRVPDDVAVIGVDNDQVLCELAEPPLSSVIPDTRRTGYLAAQLLEKLMSGRAVQPTMNLVEPLGIATRQSTDVLAIEDQEVSAAVQFIRNHACEGITVDRVLDAVPISRRMLERRFKRIVGRTPHDEIVRVQVERARQMLRGTDLPLKTIAERIGLRHGEYLSVLFKRATGIAPGAYRRGLPAREEQARGNGRRQA